MTIQAQMRILDMCKGKTIKQVEHRLSIAQIYHAQRVRLARLTLERETK